MTITSVDTDYDSLTATLIADFDNSIDQMWELWSDPRKLERWWGPPGYLSRPMTSRTRARGGRLPSAEWVRRSL